MALMNSPKYEQLDQKLLLLLGDIQPATMDQIAEGLGDTSVQHVLPDWLMSAQERGLVKQYPPDENPLSAQVLYSLAGKKVLSYGKSVAGRRLDDHLRHLDENERADLLARGDRFLSETSEDSHSMVRASSRERY